MANNIPNEDVYNKISLWLDEYHSIDNSARKSKLRDLIVFNMIPVVKKIAKTIARRSYDPIEDLVQAGSIGLLKSIDRYSKEINDNFRVYAGYLIIGEMRHYLRDKLNTIRVPRHIHELLIRINNFTETLTTEELAILTSEDVASALQVTPETIDFAMLIDRRCSTISLEEAFNSKTTLNYEEMLTDSDYEDKLEIEDIKILFDEVIDVLPPEEKVIIDMFYKQDMNRREIADALQVSQMSVTRRMKKAFCIIHKLAEEIRHSKNREET